MRTLVAASQVESGELADLAEEWRLEAELRCENAGQELAWSREGDLRLSGRQRYQLERIVRELVSNALEHGGGSRVEVRWCSSDDGALLSLSVADDGRGLPELAREVERGQGISGVRARVHALGGEVAWRPGEPRGTVCELTLPLHQRAVEGSEP